MALSGALQTASVLPFAPLRVAGREAFAFARQATLLHRDLRRSFPTSAAAGDDVVVLLHGLFATAGVLRPLREHLEAECGAHTASFSYHPGPGVRALAERLGALVRQLPHAVRLHLVGHSMGGLVVRWFVQELGGDPRVVQTVAIASPFAGSPHAGLVPGQAGRDIAAGSDVLRRLAERAPLHGHLPHLSIEGDSDETVHGAGFAVGDHLLIPECGHNGVLYHPGVHAELARRLRETQPER